MEVQATLGECSFVRQVLAGLSGIGLGAGRDESYARRKMLSIGDVFSVVAILFGTAFSAWAMLLASTLIFSRKAKISESLIRHAPGRTFMLGLATLFVASFVSLAFLSVPIPAAKLIGWTGILFVLGFATLGAGGLVLLVAERLREYDAKLRPFTALTRGTSYIVLAGLVPLLGLFLVFPAVVAMGLGAGIQALFMRQELRAAASEYVG